MDVRGLLVLAGISGLSRGDACPAHVNLAIQRCVTPVAQFAEALGLDAIRHTSSADTGPHVLRQLCARIAVFSQCTQRARLTCPGHITLALVNASYGYLCADGYQALMGNAECLMRLDKDPSVRACHDDTMRDIKNVSAAHQTPLNHKLTIMCRALTRFARCVERPIQSQCHSGAWTVIERVLRETTRVLAPSCQFEWSTGTVSWAAVSVERTFPSSHPTDPAPLDGASVLCSHWPPLLLSLALTLFMFY